MCGWGNAPKSLTGVLPQAPFMVFALTFEFFETGVVFVAFAAGGFDIEHQVLHIETQLTEGVLHKREDTAAALGALDDPL